MNSDHLSTLAGGSAGLALLSSVQWQAIPMGELVKLTVALSLIVMGYLFYRDAQ